MSKRVVPVAVLATLCLLLLQPASATVSVVLSDGRVLEGLAVTREGDDYALETADGDVIVIPAGFVTEVRLGAAKVEDEEPPEEDPDAWRHESGVIPGEARTLAGQTPVKDAPTGEVTDAKPETVAGYPTNLPSRREQTAALGPPARFQKGLFNEHYTPTTDWDMRRGVNDWAPSKWSKGVIDSSWKPESAIRQEDDQLEKHKSQWQKSIIEDNWRPADGFKNNG